MFGFIDIKTRPLRLAHLVDPNNKNQVKEAIQISSSLWGGNYFPIIPLHKKIPSTWRQKPVPTPPAKNVILGYIDAFDPDILVQFSKEVPKYISDIGIEIIKPENIWSVLDANRNLSPKYGLGVFELLDDIFEKYFKFKMKYPVEIVFPKIPKQYSLFWASWFGELPSKLLPVLEEQYFEPLEIKTPDLKIENLKDLLRRKILFPLRITHHELESYRTGFERNRCVYFLDAAKTEDIIDFWNLRAMGWMVIPLPKQFKGDPSIKNLVLEFLKANRRSSPDNPGVFDGVRIIKGRSSTMEELEEYAKVLNLNRDKEDKQSCFLPQCWYPRVWDEWARGRDHAIPSNIFGKEQESIEITDTQELRVAFKSTLPKFAQKYAYHDKPRCANEIGLRFYGANEYIAEVFPKSSGKNFLSAISGLIPFMNDWRIGSNGLVKLVKNNFNEIMDIPLAEHVFFAWLKDLSWDARLSSAGLLAKQIFRKLDGYVGVLTNEKLLGLLEHMNGGIVKQDSGQVLNNKIIQERDLSIGEVKSRLNDAGKNDLHDFLLKKGVFKIGLKLQCPHCLRNSWYSLDDIGDKFVCPLCLNSFPAIGNLDSSKWTYKTAGPFSVPNYADGAYTVLLTEHFLGNKMIPTLRITPALSFIAEAPGKRKFEVDLAAFWRESVYGESKGGILFCECKTYGTFGSQDFDRIRFLAKEFPGAVLIFSTLRKGLIKSEITGITKIAKAGRKYWKHERPINPVLILTGQELLCHYGPPYCWNDENKKNFDPLHGLISLCNATQQLYLGLASWEDERHKKWEKRYKKIDKKELIENALVKDKSNEGKL